MASGWLSLVAELDITQPSTHMEIGRSCIIKEVPNSHRHTTEQVTQRQPQSIKHMDKLGKLTELKKKKGYALGCSEGDSEASQTIRWLCPD